MRLRQIQEIAEDLFVVLTQLRPDMRTAPGVSDSTGKTFASRCHRNPDAKPARWRCVPESCGSLIISGAR